MAKFIPVVKFETLKDGELRRFEIGGNEIVVIRAGEHVYALEDRCTHEDYPLSDGYLQDGEICCMMHGASFDLKTGEVLTPPAFENVRAYNVRIQAGMVEIELD